jgi:hypothetical protein
MGGFIVVRKRQFHNSTYGKIDSGNQLYEVDLVIRPLAAFSFPVLATFSSKLTIFGGLFLIPE